MQYHGDNSDQTMQLLWFIQYSFSFLMKHTKHIIKQQSDSSGVTAWLSMADWSSPVPGLSIYYQHNKPHQLFVSDPGGGRCANVGHQHEDRANNYCGITVHVPYRLFSLRPTR